MAETKVKRYHVFADRYDEWYGEDEYEKAEADFDRLVREGYDGVRLYEDYEIYEDGEPTGNFEEGDCLKSFGNWPM